MSACRTCSHKEVTSHDMLDMFDCFTLVYHALYKFIYIALPCLPKLIRGLLLSGTCHVLSHRKESVRDKDFDTSKNLGVA